MDLCSDSDDETKITTMGLKGKAPIYSLFIYRCASSSKVKYFSKDKKRNKLFHLRLLLRTLKLMHS